MEENQSKVNTSHRISDHRHVKFGLYTSALAPVVLRPQCALVRWPGLLDVHYFYRKLQPLKAHQLIRIQATIAQ